MKTPLALLTFTFGISFCSGMFGWGLSDDAYAILGFGMIGTVIWMWIIETRR